MSPVPPRATPQPDAPTLSEKALRRGAEHLHRETELAWLHSNELPVQVLLFPSVGKPVGRSVDLWQPRAVGEAVIQQAAAGLGAKAIIACLHIGDLYLDGEPNGVFGAQPPAPLGVAPLRGEAIITVAVWPSRMYVSCLISDAHTDDHGIRLLPPRDAVPGPASAVTAPLGLPLVAWLAGMLPSPHGADPSPP